MDFRPQFVSAANLARTPFLERAAGARIPQDNSQRYKTAGRRTRPKATQSARTSRCCPARKSDALRLHRAGRSCAARNCSYIKGTSVFARRQRRGQNNAVILSHRNGKAAAREDQAPKELPPCHAPAAPAGAFSRRTMLSDLLEVGEETDARAWAEKLELTGLLDRHPFDLSGGELQRAALCKLLLRNADVLLLDEPTKGLDAYAKAELGAILKS